MAIEWNESFSVSNTELDNQHKTLFAMLDSFQNEMKINTDNTKTIPKILAGLLNYSKMHFSKEEEHMTAIDYPFLVVHRMKHQQFIEVIKKFEIRIHVEEDLNPKEIIDFIKEWLTRHIYVEDKLYANFKKEK